MPLKRVEWQQGHGADETRRLLCAVVEWSQLGHCHGNAPFLWRAVATVFLPVGFVLLVLLFLFVGAAIAAVASTVVAAHGGSHINHRQLCVAAVNKRHSHAQQHNHCRECQRHYYVEASFHLLRLFLSCFEYRFFKDGLLSIARMQPIVCKDSANERQESLLSIARMQPIVCKGSAFIPLSPIKPGVSIIISRAFTVICYVCPFFFVGCGIFIVFLHDTKKRIEYA